jgi:hypothetical protein
MPIDPNHDAFNPDSIVYFRHGNTHFNIITCIAYILLFLTSLDQVLPSKIRCQTKEPIKEG